MSQYALCLTSDSSYHHQIFSVVLMSDLKDSDKLTETDKCTSKDACMWVTH